MTPKPHRQLESEPRPGRDASRNELEFRRHRRKAAIEALSIVATMLLAVGLSVTGVWLGSRAAIATNFRHYLIGIAQSAATMVDPNLHRQLRDPAQLNGPVYVSAVEPLRRLRKALPDVHYVYTLVRDGKAVRFVLDAADPDAKSESGKPDQSTVWQAYNETSTALDRALGTAAQLGEAAADETPTTDEWGVFMTGLAPLIDASGHQFGVVGVDVDASRYLQRVRQARNRLLFGLLPAAIVAGIFGAVFYRVRLRGLIYAHAALLNVQEAHRAAQEDRLTRLCNRPVFLERLDDCLSHIRSGVSHSVTVFFLDFDRFKLVNDTLGHEAGDELLRQIAERLRRAMPGDSRVSTDDSEALVCRFGGDEFLILINELESAESAEQIANSLHQTLLRPYLIKDTEIHSSASIGIVYVTDASIAAADVVRNADVAMYEAKRRGRGRSIVFTESMQLGLARRVAVESALRHAISNGELYLEYQPIVDLGSGRCAYVEALVRWRDSVLGQIAPDEFIPIAEETGLILPLGQFVLQQSCRDMQSWLAQEPAAAPKWVSVNLSRVEIAQGSVFLERTRALLQECGLPARYIQFEITEREVMRDESGALALLKSLQSLGVHLAMDDFGTGNSSLSILRRYPFDTIKIDRSFLTEIATSREVMAVIHATIQLIENLGMTSVAEGVEDPVEVPILQSLGCQQAQGYLFSKPLPRDGVVGYSAGTLSRSIPA